MSGYQLDPTQPRFSDALTQHIQQTIVDMLADPTSLPADFKSWLPQYLETNPPLLPVSQIFGFKTDAVRVHTKATSTLDVVNTITETAVVNELIPAGQMGPSGIVRLTLLADYLNNSGGVVMFTPRIKFGGTTFIGQIEGTGVTSATRAPIRLECTIVNLGATNANQAFATLEYGYPQALGIAGIGDNSGASLVTRRWASTAQAIDTSATQSLQVTVTHSAAAATISFRRQHYMIEFL